MESSLIGVFSHWPSFPGLVPMPAHEDCKLGICIVGPALRPGLRQATSLLWAVGAEQGAGRGRGLRFPWCSVRRGLRQGQQGLQEP